MTAPAVASAAELAGPVPTAVGRWHRLARCTAAVAEIAAEDGRTPLAEHQSVIETQNEVTTYIHVCVKSQNQPVPSGQSRWTGMDIWELLPQPRLWGVGPLDPPPQVPLEAG